MLALSALDLVLSMDKHGHWLGHMTSKGYLQHIVDSLRQDDEKLQEMLQPNPEPLKALYIFESKIVSTGKIKIVSTRIVCTLVNLNYGQNRWRCYY